MDLYNPKAIAVAFECKDGTYAGVCKDKRDGSIVREKFPTLAEARNFAKAQAFRVMGDTPWVPGYRYSKSEWCMNVFA